MNPIPNAWRAPQSFDEMVRNLIAKDGLGNQWGPLLHATVGVCGEVSELQLAHSLENICEECGDIEFYLTAVEQFMPARSEDDVGLWHYGFAELPFNQLLNMLSTTAGDLLDLAKKGWVYNRDLSDQGENFYSLTIRMRNALRSTYSVFGMTREGVLLANQWKLIGPQGRYPGGKYSDADAIARKDKVLPPDTGEVGTLL